MPEGVEIAIETAGRALASGYFNLLRRDSGALVLSSDRWRLAEIRGDLIRFEPEAAEAPPLELAILDVERVSWDRLPKQRTRSQVRFHLRGGDLWTFSGRIEEAVILGA